jgi:hypothetical protein
MAAAMQTRVMVRCARCGHTCSRDAWRALPTQRTLTSVDLGACVSSWPAGAVVEVRACTGCGAAIARRVPRS